MSKKVEVTSMSDLPIQPYTLGTIDWNRTGLWRFLAPTPLDRTPPCAGACPAGTPIPRFLAELSRGNADRALELIFSVNPLPGLTGRLCYHPCQTGCLRGRVDRVLPVQLLERFVADRGAAGEKRAAVKKNAPAAAVIGAGPAGLTCAWFLARQGLRVRVFDQADSPGGFLNDAPADRLPPKVLKRELNRLVETAGLELSLGFKFNQAEVQNILAEADLVVVDSTAHARKTAAYKSIDKFWLKPDLSEAGAEVLIPDLGDDFKGFKPVRIAHAVGLGRELAGRASALLTGNKTALETTPAPPVAEEDVRFDLFEPEKPVRKQPQTALKADRAAYEAGRCLSCGTCNLCGQCILFCPDVCVGPDPEAGTVRIDLEHCKGCGVCAFECPRGVLTMEDSA